MSAGIHNIKVEQGATFSQTFTWKISSNLVDLTGYLARLKVRDTTRRSSAVNEMISLTSPSGGIVLGGAAGTIAVTISSLPQNENVTVKTVIRDSITNTETVIANTVVETLSANLPVLTPARSAVNDRATITRPSVSSMTSNADGSRTASVLVPEIPNFDSSKSWATLMVTDKNGSTTAIGTDGSAQTLSVGSLGATGDYTVKVVVRDLATGQETTINGDMIP